MNIERQEFPYGFKQRRTVFHKDALFALFLTMSFLTASVSACRIFIFTSRRKVLNVAQSLGCDVLCASFCVEPLCNMSALISAVTICLFLCLVLNVLKEACASNTRKSLLKVKTWSSMWSKNTGFSR